MLECGCRLCEAAWLGVHAVLHGGSPASADTRWQTRKRAQLRVTSEQGWCAQALCSWAHCSISQPAAVQTPTHMCQAHALRTLAHSTELRRLWNNRQRVPRVTFCVVTLMHQCLAPNANTRYHNGTSQHASARLPTQPDLDAKRDTLSS